MRADDVHVTGVEVEIVSRLAPASWRPDRGDPGVKGDPELELEEQAEHKVALDDQVLEGGREFLLLTLASERSPDSQLTGWRRTSRRAAWACDCRSWPRRSNWASSLGNRAPFIHAETCRKEMDWEVQGTVGSSLRSSDDLGDREGMSTGEEGMGGTE